MVLFTCPFSLYRFIRQSSLIELKSSGWVFILSAAISSVASLWNYNKTVYYAARTWNFLHSPNFKGEISCFPTLTTNLIHWIHFCTSRRPTICNNETRNISFKPLLGCFWIVCLNRILLKDSMLSKKREYCLAVLAHFHKHVAGTVLPMFKPLFPEVKRCYGFTEDSPPNQCNSWKVTTLNLWNSILRIWKLLHSFCLFDY